jgi:hypothetical protein
MNWLRSVVAGLFDAIFSWGQKQAEKPKTIEDAETPEQVKTDFRNTIADRLRNRADGDAGQQ